MDPEYSESQSPIPQPLAILAVVVVHFVALALAVFVLCAIVPKYVKFFAKMEVELPAVTKPVIQLSAIAVDYWYLILLLAVIGDAVIVWLLGSLAAPQRWLLAAYSHLCLLAIIVFLVLVAIAIGYPVIFLAHQPIAL